MQGWDQGEDMQGSGKQDMGGPRDRVRRYVIRHPEHWRSAGVFSQPAATQGTPH